MLDSGTTFNYLPTSAFLAVLKTLTAHMRGKEVVSVPGPDPTVRRTIPEPSVPF